MNTWFYVDTRAIPMPEWKHLENVFAQHQPQSLAPPAGIGGTPACHFVEQLN